MTQLYLDRQVEKQREEFNSAVSAWEKYDDWFTDTFTEFDKAMVARANIRPGHKALDLGSGLGNPALTVASIVGDKGSVVGMDVAERMLDVARSRARAHGLKNLEFHACDVGALPFQDDNFDVATARFCVMLVPNASRALEEIIRVLKPGANFTASVWADPSRNVCLTIAMKILREFVEMSKPAPNAPGLFSQSKPGNLIAKMKEVGFIHTSEETIQIEFSFPSLEFFIANRTEMAPAIRAVLEMLDAPTRALAIEKLAEEGRKYQQPDGSIKFSGEAMIVSGIKGNAQQPSGNC